VSLLTGLVLANLAAASAILAVLALRQLVRPRFGARAAYALWAAPLVTALALIAPHRGSALLAPLVLQAGQATARALPSLVPLSAEAALIAIWLAGAVAMAGVLHRRQAAFLRSAGRLEPIEGAPRLVRAERTDIGPAVVGVLRPRIVAPFDFETRFTTEERALILAHERAHLASGDALINAVACAVQCLCWFNPLAHLAVGAMRIDQELACDATVAHRFPAERRRYAELLLKTQVASHALPIGCHWRAGATHPLKARIAMLKAPQPARSERVAGLGVAVLVAIAGANGAWAAKPTPHVIVKADWVVKPKGVDLVEFYPPEAAKSGIGGAATIGCAVSAEGRLAHCRVLDETPAQAGFGEAALKLSESFQMKPMSRDGQPVSGGTVRIPIRFALPRAPQPVAPS
jgi:TonB family protein